MTRVSRSLRLFVCSVYFALGGCASSSPDTADQPIQGALKLVFSPMYSAFDGVHQFQLPVTVDQAALDANGVDSVLPDTIKWTVDSKMVSSEPYPSLPGGVLLTTKDSGMTTVTAIATTKTGRKVQGSSLLTITRASDADWMLGDARYNNNVAINLGMFGGMPGGMTSGGPVDISMLIPRDASCANCHNNTSGITVEHSPQQTAGYSDDELINIFTKGAKPMGATFNSAFLKRIPAAYQTTIYQMLHTWDIAPDVQLGIVYKLRSITPAPQPEIDTTRLRMMGMGMPNPAAGGAAGAP